MASNLKYSSALKTAMQAAISTQAGASAVLTLYSGTQPASPDTAITSQVALSTHTCAATFGSAASGVLTVGAIANGTGTAGAGAGTAATWYRLTTSGGTALIDGSIGTSGADLNLTGTTSIATGQTVSITSWTLTNGN
ncbi:hypothetical protein [Paraburkholderia dilworthii]|uniref:hypothetical protein n=1 Tax=Paraburkholderia dilworthii TaxID=948106 RepID=UPI00041EF9F4|nr:hypothetical protein [Paraburkholderia dilworthii]